MGKLVMISYLPVIQPLFFLDRKARPESLFPGRSQFGIRMPPAFQTINFFDFWGGN